MKISVHVTAEHKDRNDQSRAPPASSGVQYVSLSNALNKLRDLGNRRGVHTAVRATLAECVPRLLVGLS